MLTVTQAAQKATAHLRELVPTSSQILVEETIAPGPHWIVTLSFSNGVETFMGLTTRQYKEFALDPESGDVITMKVRKFDK